MWCLQSNRIVFLALFYWFGELFYVTCCGSAGSLQRSLLPLIHHLIPLSLLSKPQLQLHCLENILIGNPLLAVGRVSVLPHDAPALRFEWAFPTRKPIHDRDDGQWDGGMVVREWGLLGVLIHLLPQLKGGQYYNEYANEEREPKAAKKVPVEGGLRPRLGRNAGGRGLG